ncbi:hypothetical protein PSTG_12756 [Puccinia striiformis f. sp. tritici PST-78]|uniref:HAT C-terminal dimerisation domain-containing protein n=1 Tax=Puccinia striiformis f. sp. tritici PST-78 TaxID=1165861 RepID=A0A0L0V3G8_9BASI|nr:hypothetical protein PSTG_12756 [Puccinia striiformis f. sp. tritici PST-78]
MSQSILQHRAADRSQSSVELQQNSTRRQTQRQGSLSCVKNTNARSPTPSSAMFRLVGTQHTSSLQALLDVSMPSSYGHDSRDKNFGTNCNVHLTQADLDLAQDLVKLLEQFYEFTSQLSTGASTRVAEVVVWIDQITADLSTVVANDEDHFPPALQNACRAGLQITNKYYLLTNLQDHYGQRFVEPPVLHPSFKDKYFKLAKWPQSWVDKAITLTCQMYERWYKPKPCEAAKTPKKGPQKAQTGVLAGLGVAAIARLAELLSDPIDIWLLGGLVLDKGAPVNGLRWWTKQKRSGNTHHGLLSMALDVMSCPATAVDVERTFNFG